jgi:hypothetical protein
LGSEGPEALLRTDLQGLNDTYTQTTASPLLTNEQIIIIVIIILHDAFIDESPPPSL